MSDKKNLFSEFPDSSKEEWLQKIASDLKNRSLEDLRWQATPDWAIDPFYSWEDFEVPPCPLAGNKTSNKWQTGEDIDAGADIDKANEMALVAISGGVDAPRFVLQDFLNRNQLHKLFENIQLDAIAPCFSGPGLNERPERILEVVKEIARDFIKDTKDLQGGADIYPLEEEKWQDAEKLSTFLAFGEIHLPAFRLMTIRVPRLFEGVDRIEEELALAIAQGATLIRQLNVRFPEKLIGRKVKFAVPIGTSFFMNIAKIRALRLIWANVLNGFDADHKEEIFVDAYISNPSGKMDPNSFRISSTTQAISAVVGGADRMTIQPKYSGDSPAEADFGKRIARNVGHLLKMESHFDKVIDPAAGSYYIEQLTQVLAGRSWAKFQEIEAAGGYWAYQGK